MKDILGVTLEVGQKVAFADLKGRNAFVRAGTIEALNQDEGLVTVRWIDPGYGPKVSRLAFRGVFVDRPRFVVIDNAVKA